MDNIRQYILSITGAAMICSICLAFFRKKSAYSSVIKMISGLFLTIVFIAPLVDFRFDKYVSFFESFSLEAEASAGIGSDYYEESFVALIKEKTEAYILDKAAQMGFSVQAEVTIGDGDPPLPTAVILEGNLPPLRRKMLTEQLSTDLNIAKENLVWK